MTDIIIPSGFKRTTYWNNTYTKISLHTPCYHGTTCTKHLDCHYYHHPEDLEHFHQMKLKLLQDKMKVAIAKEISKNPDQVKKIEI